jgi:drug/metabolite transporter (DMT)-like permease
MLGAFDALALIVVGCLWGCTNPILRRASLSLPNEENSHSSETLENQQSVTQTILLALAKFRHVSVYLPYLLNQSGSLLFYYVLSRSSISLAVPVCNGLSLVFAVTTSYFLGERVDKPFQAAMGAALVISGVALCVFSQPSNEVADQ